MDTSTTQKGNEPTDVAPEFGTWPVEGTKLQNVIEVRSAYDHLLKIITPLFPKENGRYLALVKTKLEEACLLTVKGIAKPGNIGTTGGGNA